MDSKLQGIFVEILQVPSDRIHAGTSTETEAEWDSLRHMNLIFAIEDTFGIRFDDDEIATLTSIQKIEKALAKRHP